MIRAWLFMILGMFYPCQGSAAQLEQWIGRATDISIVKVTEGVSLSSNGVSACNFKYKVEVENRFRGSAPTAFLITDVGLTIGERYLLVIARASPWNSRSFATDIPTAADPVSQCKGFSDIVLVRSAEIRPIERVLSSTIDWVQFPSYMFSDSAGIRIVSDMNRIELTKHRIEWPPVQFFDHFLLSDIVKIVQESKGGGE